MGRVEEKMGSSKRSSTSNSVTLNSNKKQKKSTTKPIVELEEEPSAFDSEEDFEDEEGGNDFEDLEAALDEFENAMDDEDDDDSEEDDEEDEGDSEINEFELEENGLDSQEEEEEEEDEEDDDLIGDDGEDLMANLDNGSEDEDDSEEDDEEDEKESNSGIPAPTPFKKANVRNSKAPAPLKPEELRALAFAELTASPISTLLSTQVSTFLKPLAPPTPATSPLQPLLKLLHSHITSLPSQPTSTLREMKKKGIVVPKLEGDEAKWSKVEMGFEKPKPEEVRIVGSWAWGGCLRVNGEYFVDMSIAIPEVNNFDEFLVYPFFPLLTFPPSQQTLLQPKDYLYPRFLYKSTHYLVTLASLLPSTLGPVSLSYSSLPLSQGFSLEIRSARKSDSTEPKVGLSLARGAVLRLRIVSPLEFFPASKLSPLSNISRPSLAPSTTSTSSTTPFPPTPLQCSSLLLSSLSLQTTHLKYLHALTLSHPSFNSTVRLLQAWAMSRSYASTLGLSSEFWAWCTARSLNWGISADSSKKGLGVEVAGGEAWAGWRKVVEWLAGCNWSEGVFFRVESEGAVSLFFAT